MRMIFLFFFLSFYLSNKSYAQKIFGDVTLIYDITAKSLNDNKSVSGFEGARFSLTLKGQQSKAESISKLGSEITVNDNKNRKAFILKQYSSQKLMITLTPDEWTKKNQFLSSLKFKNSAERKNISGYDCIKASANAEDGSLIEVFYTADYILPNTSYSNSFPDLKGMPVQFAIKSGNLHITYTLQTINTDFIPPSAFDSPKAGFRIMSYADATKEIKN